MTSATIIDGKAFAAGLRTRIATQVVTFRDAAGRAPGLAVVLVGEDPASSVYVRSKGKATREAGMESFEHRLPADTDQATLLALVEQLNADPTVDGILVQLPLPGQIDAQAVIQAIDPDKDVDGFHPVNAGRLATGVEGFVPCTPLGCLMLLKSIHPSLSGMDAVVVGRSNIVGKPMAQLLLARDCTVTIAHSRTRDLPAKVAQADIVVAAVGAAEMIRGEWIRPGATVIDIGTSRVERDGRKTLVGDVDFAGAKERAGAITPVPGGVGPMTIMTLMHNAVLAAHRRAGLPDPVISERED